MQQHLLNGTLQPLPKPKPAKPTQTRAERDAARASAKKNTVEYDYHQPAATEREVAFRHSHWKTKRAKVLKALIAAGTTISGIDRFTNCGSDAVVQWNEEEGRYRVACNCCKNRNCEPCQRARANTMAGNLRSRLDLEAAGRYRFVTLTLRHTDTPLIDQVKRLQVAFKKLRSTSLWSDTQKGGAAILEIKWSGETRRWHPHLHVITEGGFIRQDELSSAWHSATGDSHIVDIRQLKNGRDAAFYVSKYVTKGTSSEVWNDLDAAVEWIIAMRGVRVCNTFGSWRGFKLMKPPACKGEWKTLERVTDLMNRVAAGSLTALLLYYKLPGPQHEDEPYI